MYTYIWIPWISILIRLLVLCDCVKAVFVVCGRVLHTWPRIIFWSGIEKTIFKSFKMPTMSELSDKGREEKKSERQERRRRESMVSSRINWAPIASSYLASSFFFLLNLEMKIHEHYDNNNMRYIFGSITTLWAISCVGLQIRYIYTWANNIFYYRTVRHKTNKNILRPPLRI